MVYSIKITYTLNVNTMEKGVRKLISNSLRLRAWTTLSNYKAIHTSLQNTADTVQSSQTADVVKNVQQGFETVNGRETTKMIHTLGRVVAMKLHPEKIRGSDNLAKICNKIQKDIRLLNTHDIIISLRVLMYLNVPLNTKLNQMLLQLLRTSVNDLTITQIRVIDSLLHKEQEVPLVKALLNALPHAFRNRLHIEVNDKTIYTALTYARNIEDIQSLHYILNILKFINLKTVQLRDITSIFHALYILPHLFNFHLKFLSMVNDVIIARHADLQTKEVKFLLAIIVKKFKEKDRKTYLWDESVIGALCDNIVSRNINLHSSILILEKLNTMRYIHVPLLNHLAEQCVKDNYLLTNCTEIEVCIFIQGLVIADYKTYFPKIIEKLLSDHFANSSYSGGQLATIALQLLSLGYHCPDLFEKVFTLYYCGYDDMKNERMMREVLRLHQALQYLHPEYNGVTLSLDMVDKAIGILHPGKVVSIHENLIEVIGGTKYIKTNLKTRLGHFIDYTVVLEPDGFPVAISDYNNDVTFVEDLVFPPDCCKLLICMLPESAYSTNLKNLLSTWKLTMNVIKAATGANVLPLSSHLLKTLSNNEKNRYLQEVLKLKSKEHLNCINC